MFQNRKGRHKFETIKQWVLTSW